MVGRLLAERSVRMDDGRTWREVLVKWVPTGYADATWEKQTDVEKGNDEAVRLRGFFMNDVTFKTTQ